MTEEEQAQLRTELSEAKAAAAEARTRTQKLDAELRAQRERNDLLNQEARAAEHAVVEIEIEKLVGTKITPASRAKFTALAQEKGIHYVQELLADQEDLKLLAPVSVQNRPLSHVQLAAPPVEGSDGSSDILKSVNGKLGLTSRT
jgi:hypothetical protein